MHDCNSVFLIWTSRIVYRRVFLILFVHVVQDFGGRTTLRCNHISLRDRPRDPRRSAAPPLASAWRRCGCGESTARARTASLNRHILVNPSTPRKRETSLKAPETPLEVGKSRYASDSPSGGFAFARRATGPSVHFWRDVFLSTLLPPPRVGSAVLEADAHWLRAAGGVGPRLPEVPVPGEEEVAQAAEAAVS